jgi:hypothetical protein
MESQEELELFNTLTEYLDPKFSKKYTSKIARVIPQLTLNKSLEEIFAYHHYCMTMGGALSSCITILDNINASNFIGVDSDTIKRLFVEYCPVPAKAINRNIVARHELVAPIKTLKVIELVESIAEKTRGLHYEAVHDTLYSSLKFVRELSQAIEKTIIASLVNIFNNEESRATLQETLSPEEWLLCLDFESIIKLSFLNPFSVLDAAKTLEDAVYSIATNILYADRTIGEILVASKLFKAINEKMRNKESASLKTRPLEELHAELQRRPIRPIAERNIRHHEEEPPRPEVVAQDNGARIFPNIEHEFFAPGGFVRR